jgi:ParB family chromosome partitioning protein
MNKPRGLGKGLGAIFQDKAEAHRHDLPDMQVAPGTKVETLNLDRIQPNPFQPRKEFNPEELEELATSIREKGVFQPILVRAQGDTYQIIAGERRFRASLLAGRTSIPALVREQVTDREMREVALLENIQRVQLNPIEEADAYQELINDCGYSHDQLSERLGKSRPAITNSLRLLRLHPEVRELVSKSVLSAGHARTLVSFPEEQQLTFARQAAEEQLSVRALEQLTSGPAKERKNPSAKASSTKEVDPNIQSFVRTVEQRLGTRVVLEEAESGKGTLKIQFHSRADLNRIAEIILGLDDSQG